MNYAIEIREKMADFIGDYLSTKNDCKENYQTSIEPTDDCNLINDVHVSWVRRCNMYKEWSFRSSSMSKRAPVQIAFVYDLDESPNQIYVFDLGPDPQNPFKFKKSNIRKVKIDNVKNFQRGSFLIKF